ncbi:glutaredoxin 3 [Sinimarinibacterium sp. CAU 1509]|uniref:glutaredoxin 3 n=1 Tax=Sinimarinibacterium sp. CAU 1509 TaxID=2562283 RepID=UPI00200B60EE|nr:glutaredoxin 3 [Sinimarinibacterium sp. CAU 1509]
MKSVRMYSTLMCPFCVMARRLLASKGVAVEEIRVDQAPEKRVEMRELTGRHTVPQIFIGEQHVGGCDDLYALDRSGQLDPLLNND